MHQELDKVLCSDYPQIFVAKPQSDHPTFGFECGNGWYKLIDAACSLIQSEVNTRHFEQFRATQVKEKFGGLRFYHRGGTKYATSAISLVEALSLHVCEICGALGKGVSLFGWMQTRCPVHDQASAYESFIQEGGIQIFLKQPVMGDLLGSALDLFSCDGPAAARWLSQPVLALGNVVPLTLTTTLEGQHRVMGVIGRLEHGIPK